MPPRPPLPRHPALRAFTLLEVLIAIALSALVLSAAALLLTTMSGIWHDRRSGDPFTEHIAGLRTFLQTMVDRSEVDASTTTGAANTGAGVGAAATLWTHPPGYPDFDPPYLTFGIPDPPALLLAGGPPLPALRAWLVPVPNEGLFLLFHSRLEEASETDDLRFRLLSPWLESVAYAMFDPENDSWEETTEVPLDDSRNPAVPGALLLNFRLGEQAEQIVLHLPTARHVPLP